MPLKVLVEQKDSVPPVPGTEIDEDFLGQDLV